MPGFVERLKEDLDRISPGGGASPLASVIPHPTSHEPGYNTQRKHAPWIGGSMLASLSPFKQVWMDTLYCCTPSLWSIRFDVIFFFHRTRFSLWLVFFLVLLQLCPFFS